MRREVASASPLCPTVQPLSAAHAPVVLMPVPLPCVRIRARTLSLSWAAEFDTHTMHDVGSNFGAAGPRLTGQECTLPQVAWRSRAHVLATSKSLQTPPGPRCPEIGGRGLQGSCPVGIGGEGLYKTSSTHGSFWLNRWCLTSACAQKCVTQQNK